MHQYLNLNHFKLFVFAAQILVFRTLFVLLRPRKKPVSRSWEQCTHTRLTYNWEAIGENSCVLLNLRLWDVGWWARLNAAFLHQNHRENWCDSTYSYIYLFRFLLLFDVLKYFWRKNKTWDFLMFFEIWTTIPN